MTKKIRWWRTDDKEHMLVATNEELTEVAVPNEAIRERCPQCKPETARLKVWGEPAKVVWLLWDCSKAVDGYCVAELKEEV